MIFNVIAAFICGMFLVMFSGTLIASTIALAKSCLSKPFEWADTIVLCMVMFMSVFALIGAYSIVTMIGNPA